MFNLDSEKAVGLQVAELLGTNNNHLLGAMNKLSNPQDKEQEKPTPKSSESMLGTFLITSIGTDSKQDQKQMKVPINFHCYRLTNDHKQTFGFLMVLQPIIITKS